LIFSKAMNEKKIRIVSLLCSYYSAAIEQGCFILYDSFAQCILIPGFIACSKPNSRCLRFDVYGQTYEFNARVANVTARHLCKVLEW